MFMILIYPGNIHFEGARAWIALFLLIIDLIFFQIAGLYDYLAALLNRLRLFKQLARKIVILFIFVHVIPARVLFCYFLR
jgi:nitrogen fixation/metabolism regulation signal transduction histidine kinase